MPGIIIIDKRPNTPERRLPKNVKMSTIQEKRYGCPVCRKILVEYADGTLRCQNCRTNVSYTDALDSKRPSVKPVEVGVTWTTYNNI